MEEMQKNMLIYREKKVVNVNKIVKMQLEKMSNSKCGMKR
jgi:hypothetical protein